MRSNPTQRIVFSLAALGLLVGASLTASASDVQLVRPDGSYPTVPLEKDTVVVKVVQNGVRNLQDYDNVQDQENLGEEILNVYLEKLSCFVGKFVNPECWKKKGKNTHVVFTSFFDDLLK